MKFRTSNGVVDRDGTGGLNDGGRGADDDDACTACFLED